MTETVQSMLMYFDRSSFICSEALWSDSDHRSSPKLVIPICPIYWFKLFRALLFSFLICGALAYVLIILYDSQEIDDSIKDHVETEFVSEGHNIDDHSAELVLFEKSLTHNFDADGRLGKTGGLDVRSKVKPKEKHEHS